ncbi:PP2C family protein-serine/threonine phosphatase [Lapillicoccus jejuensis]|uniref:PP2C family protein-serine/threonine phosphatase n=1 Tax=Lapillicoccus jejuensis TaxID=402171 RepID=UPI001FE513AE|nr:protein phosphatase 2C domain-containing protein [Lapillicoccus jejuensis]
MGGVVIHAPALAAALATDTGRVRTLNEDSALAAGTIFVVADGMGGHAAGEVASRIAADAVARLDGRPGLRVEHLVAQVEEANREIVAEAGRHPDRRGMGTTVAGVAVVDVAGAAHWAVFNVGDSRVYHLRPDSSLVQVSVDHSEVQELVDAGVITAEQARRHPARHVVTRSLGHDPLGGVDTWVVPQEAGDRFLVCSDGLTNEVEDAEIRGVLLAVPDVGAAARELVQRARDRGGRDNITVIVVAFGRVPSGGADHDRDDGEEETVPRDRPVEGDGQVTW